MVIQFQKLGVVTVGTSEPGQEINLSNPIGVPMNIDINMIEETVKMTIKATDEDKRNEVVRVYEMQMSKAAMMAFVTQVFVSYIRPTARESFEEFKDLIDLGIS